MLALLGRVMLYCVHGLTFWSVIIMQAIANFADSFFTVAARLLCSLLVIAVFGGMSLFFSLMAASVAPIGFAVFFVAMAAGVAGCGAVMVFIIMTE